MIYALQLYTQESAIAALGDDHINKQTDSILHVDEGQLCIHSMHLEQVSKKYKKMTTNVFCKPCSCCIMHVGNYMLVCPLLSSLLIRSRHAMRIKANPGTNPNQNQQSQKQMPRLRKIQNSEVPLT